MKTNRREFLKQMGILGLVPVISSSVFAEVTGKTFPVLNARGSYGTIGFLHGKTFKGRIKKNLEFYKMWITSPFEDRHKELYQAADTFIPVLKDAFPEQLEEMEGIARGAGLSLTEIMIINARTDLKFLFTQIKPLKVNPGCTTMAIQSGIKNKPSLALGQNWDWNASFIDTSVMLRITPENGKPLVTFTEAGMLGKIGFNSDRLGVCLNFLQHMSNDKASPTGVPIHCLLRAVMESSTLKEAHRKVALSKRCASANFLMAQFKNGQPEIMNLEITPDSVAVLRDQNHFMIHTNHYVSPSLEGGCMVKGALSSENRYHTGKKILNTMDLVKSNPVNAMKKTLSLREGAPFSISRSPAPGSQSTTIASIIMDLSGNSLFLSAGSPHENPWIEYPGI